MTNTSIEALIITGTISRSFIHRLPLDKPIIFLDLNQFTHPKYTLVKLEQKEGSLYPIPVLDKRVLIPETIKLEDNLQTTYDQVIENIAIYILTQFFTDPSSLPHLTNYLKKIRLFQCDFNAPLRVEISYQGQIYYKLVQLPLDQLSEITRSNIDSLVCNINNLAISHPEYHFVVISEYNTLTQFRNKFTQNIVVPNTIQTEFTTIWQQKQINNLSLFGQYLDQVEFLFMKNSQQEWFKILSSEQAEQIYYEGDSNTCIFTACLSD